MALMFGKSVFHLSCPAFLFRRVTTLSQSWNGKALLLLQEEHRALAYPTALQPGAPLFVIRVCLLLAVLTQ